MSAVDYSDRREAVRWMEDTAARRLQTSVKNARASVARLMGLPPGMLEDIRKGRLKALRGYVERAIDAGFVRALEREIRILDHELTVAKARGVAPDRERLDQVLASREALAALIREAERDGRVPPARPRPIRPDEGAAS